MQNPALAFLFVFVALIFNTLTSTSHAEAKIHTKTKLKQCTNLLKKGPAQSPQAHSPQSTDLSQINKSHFAFIREKFLTMAPTYNRTHQASEYFLTAQGTLDLKKLIDLYAVSNAMPPLMRNLLVSAFGTLVLHMEGPAVKSIPFFDDRTAAYRIPFDMRYTEKALSVARYMLDTAYLGTKPVVALDILKALTLSPSVQRSLETEKLVAQMISSVRGINNMAAWKKVAPYLHSHMEYSDTKPSVIAWQLRTVGHILDTLLYTPHLQHLTERSARVAYDILSLDEVYTKNLGAEEQRILLHIRAFAN